MVGPLRVASSAGLSGARTATSAAKLPVIAQRRKIAETNPPPWPRPVNLASAPIKAPLEVFRSRMHRMLLLRNKAKSAGTNPSKVLAVIVTKTPGDRDLQTPTYQARWAGSYWPCRLFRHSAGRTDSMSPKNPSANVGWINTAPFSKV